MGRLVELKAETCCQIPSIVPFSFLDVNAEKGIHEHMVRLSWLDKTLLGFQIYAAGGDAEEHKLCHAMACELCVQRAHGVRSQNSSHEGRGAG